MLFRKILVGFDGSKGSWEALRRALALAAPFSAEVWALSVIEIPHWTAAVAEVDEQRALLEERYRQLHDEARQVAAQKGISFHTLVKVGHSAQTLVSTARAGEFDLLVIGHSGHSGVWGTFLGTTADKVVRHAPCTVMVVRW
uniref:Universal stress protein n=2 Tax=Thermorudis TaxID=1649508 RepID=A0A7C3A9R4_9BACT